VVEVKVFPTMKDLNIIKRTVCYYHGIRVRDIDAETRKDRIIEARFHAIKLSKELTKKTVNQLGEYYKKDHSTISNAIKQVNNLYDTEEYYRKDYETLKKLVIHALKNAQQDITATLTIKDDNKQRKWHYTISGVEKTSETKRVSVKFDSLEDFIRNVDTAEFERIIIKIKPAPNATTYANTNGPIPLNLTRRKETY
jgi:hypothetical protein